MKKVLIVDDAIIMRIMLRDIFEAHGIEVAGEAEDADEALDVYIKTCPDLVTMDITLASSSGIDAISKILNHDCNAKIIVISALEQRKFALDALSMGAIDFIIKPFEEERVLSSVMNALK